MSMSFVLDVSSLALDIGTGAVRFTEKNATKTGVG
jgi:hypothetical protein